MLPTAVLILTICSSFGGSMWADARTVDPFISDYNVDLLGNDVYYILPRQLTFGQ